MSLPKQIDSFRYETSSPYRLSASTTILATNKNHPAIKLEEYHLKKIRGNIKETVACILACLHGVDELNFYFLNSIGQAVDFDAKKIVTHISVLM